MGELRRTLSQSPGNEDDTNEHTHKYITIGP